MKKAKRFRTRTYIVIVFMLVFIISGVVSFIQSTDLSFINNGTIAEKVFGVCLSLFILWFFCIAIYGAINLSEEVL